MININRLSIVVIVILIFTLFVSSYNNEVASSTSGAPASRTGSPGDNNLTCTTCHSGPSATIISGMITSNIPASGYTPGNVYTITATIQRPGHSKFGFEVSPQSITGALLGTLMVTNTTETKLVGSSKYITHTSGGTGGAGGNRTWTFNWMAPSSGTGDVTFYGAFLATNSMNNSSGDSVFRSTLLVNECMAPGKPAAIFGNTNVCSFSTNYYRIDSVPGATSYTWTIPTGWTLNSINDSISITTSEITGTISVHANSSCGSGQEQTLQVNVTNIVSSPGATDETCFGIGNGTANVSPAGGTGTYSFLWNTSPTQTTAAISNLTAGNYQVIVTDANSCIDTTEVDILSPTPLLINSGSDQTICLNESVTLGGTTLGSVPPYTFNWLPSADLDHPTIENPVATPMTNTLYQLIVIDANGCSGSSSVMIDVNPLPVQPQINISGDTLFATSAHSHQWFLFGNLITNANSSFYIPIQSGDFSVTTTDINGCTSTSSLFPFIINGINSLDYKSTLNIFPNPASSTIFIELPIDDFYLSVYDSKGNVIDNNISFHNKSELNVSDFAEGVYILVAVNDEKIYRKMFVVSR